MIASPTGIRAVRVGHFQLSNFFRSRQKCLGSADRETLWQGRFRISRYPRQLEFFLPRMVEQTARSASQSSKECEDYGLALAMRMTSYAIRSKSRPALPNQEIRVRGRRRYADSCRRCSHPNCLHLCLQRLSVDRQGTVGSRSAPLIHIILPRTGCTRLRVRWYSALSTPCPRLGFSLVASDGRGIVIFSRNSDSIGVAVQRRFGRHNHNNLFRRNGSRRVRS